MQISNSAVDKYLDCSYAYKLHYIDKIRANSSSSNLLWGSAIDAGLNEILSSKLDPPHLLPTPNTAFMKEWCTFKINDVEYDAKFCTLVEYNKKDLDLGLFGEDQYTLIKHFYPSEDPIEFAARIENARNQLHWSSYAKLEEETKKAYNYLCWLSLVKKAELIFQAYSDEVLPLIKKVVAIQREVNLTNADGDTVKGFIDFIAEMKDGSVRVMDNKTTSDFKYYKEDSVAKSQQLSLYGFVEDLNQAGYVAILKEIKADGRKKGSLPKVKIRLILGNLDPDFQNEALNKFHLVNTQIKNKEFHKKKDRSECVFFFKECPYAALCWEGKMNGLIKK